MDLDHARAIVNACARHVLWRQGLQPDPPPSLGDYSLAELVEANHLMRANGSANCDDRLVAALYVAYHWHAHEPDDDQIDPVAVSCHGAGVVVVRVPPPA